MPPFKPETWKKLSYGDPSSVEGFSLYVLADIRGSLDAHARRQAKSACSPHTLSLEKRALYSELTVKTSRQANPRAGKQLFRIKQILPVSLHFNGILKSHKIKEPGILVNSLLFTVKFGDLVVALP